MLSGQAIAPDGAVLPAAVHEREFASDPLLTATSKQAIVFGVNNEQSIGRFNLSAGTHKFCLEGGAGYFTDVNIQASDGGSLTLPLDRQGCANAEVPEGIVSVTLGHRSTPKPPTWVTASLHVDRPEANPYIPPVPLVDSQNSPVSGYWAIQDLNYNARGTFGNRMLSTVPVPNTPNSAAGMILIDPSTSFDGLSLWQLPPVTGSVSYPPYPQALFYSGNAYWWLPITGPYVVSSCGNSFFDYCENAYGETPLSEYPPDLQITDLGNYAFRFNLNPDIGGESLYSQSVNGQIQLVPTLGGVPPDTFQVLFRFLPGDYPSPQLNPGEVQIFQGCSYQGQSSIFIPLMGAGVVSGGYNLASLSSSTTTLDNTGQSVHVGPGSSIYWGSDQTNLQGAVVSNQSCMSNKPTGQLFVEPVSNTLTVAHDLLNNACTNCVLAGQALNPAAGSPSSNYQGWDFTGADFSHSNLSNLDFTGATLSGAKFVGATLSNVTLNSLQLSTAGLDFTGAILNHVTFNGTNISNFNFSNGTLTNVDLSSTTAPGGNLTFTGATMNQVNLNGVNPAIVAATGAAFCGVSLAGTGSSGILDLTSGPFANVTVTISSSCTANLAYTIINATAVAGSSWNGFNFTGTQINLPPGQVLSTQANPLDFTKVQIAGMSLQAVILDYATGLAGRTLSGIKLNNSSLRFVNLSGAYMYGAQLPNANLEGANMSGVYLTKSADQPSAANLGGAFLRNVNLSNAKLSGADFSDASFYSQKAVGQGTCVISGGFTVKCATAASATLDGTQFTGAYLFGTDFTDVTAQGVFFKGAFLAGANFAGATFTAANNNGSDSGFQDAFLQGTNMAKVTLKNGISLDGAYVDFTPNNTIFLVLGGAHTSFPGYWNTPGQSVCAEMNYPTATTVPPTDGSTTCPNNSSSDKGCGPAFNTNGTANTNWKSTIDISSQASYLKNSTFTPASGTPICNADIQWVPLSFSEPPPPPPPPPHRCRRHHPPVHHPKKPHGT